MFFRIGTEKRDKPLTQSTTPGPGAYSPKMAPSGPQYSTSLKNEPKPKPSPGPGAYNPKTDPVQKSGQQYSVGFEKRTLLKELNSNPGPGQHDAPGSFGGPQFGFGSEVRK